MRILSRLVAVSLTLVLVGPVALAASKPPKQGTGLPNSTMGISGLASSARHCIGTAGANTHHLGYVPAGTRIVVTFVSDFDPVAAVTIMQMGSGAPNGARASYLYDDDSGGNLEPELRFNPEHSGTAVLHVSKYSQSEGSGGCYFYKTEITTP